MEGTGVAKGRCLNQIIAEMVDGLKTPLLKHLWITVQNILRCNRGSQPDAVDGIDDLIPGQAGIRKTDCQALCVERIIPQLEVVLKFPFDAVQTMDQAVGNFLGHRRFGIEFAPDEVGEVNGCDVFPWSISHPEIQIGGEGRIPEINAIDGIDVDPGVSNMLLPIIVVGNPDNLA